MLCDVDFLSICDILAGPLSGITAPHKQTSVPSIENLIPYAVLPSGLLSSEIHLFHASLSIAYSSLFSKIGDHHPNRSRAKVSGSICSHSEAIVLSNIRLPSAGFVLYHLLLSFTSPISFSENSDQDVLSLFPLIALSRIFLKTVPSQCSSGGVPIYIVCGFLLAASAGRNEACCSVVSSCASSKIKRSP